MDRGEHQMSEWINCGLPWDISIWNNYEEFQTLTADLEPEINKILGEMIHPLEELNSALWTLIQEDVGLDEYGFVLDMDKADNHPLQVERAEIRTFIDEEYKRLDLEESVFIEREKRRTAYEESRKLLSFCGRELNKPGVLVEVNGKQYLLGHINAENVDAGCCGSSAFEDKDIVTRYKVIWHQPDTNP